MANDIVAFSQDLAQHFFSASEQFVVDFELAWQWLGYSSKANAKRKLSKHLIKGKDYSSDVMNRESGGASGVSAVERIMLTVDAFKALGMMAGTEKGKEIREYFLDCERKAKELAARTLPQSFAEALQLAADQQKAIELQEAQIKLLEADNERQAEAIDELFEYSSIIRVAKFNGCSEKAFAWHKLKAASKAIGVEIKKVPCPRFGEKSLYSHDAWRLAYPEYRLPETTTLRLPC